MTYPPKAERNAKIARQYNAGIPLISIAREHGISVHRVKEIAWENGAIPRYRTRRSQQIRHQALAEEGL